MKNFRFLSTCLLILILVSTMVGCGNRLPATLTTEDKLEDFEYLFKFISENFPYLKVNERMHGVNWLEEKETFRAAIEKTRNDLEFNVEIIKILRRLNNEYTHTFDSNWFSYAYFGYTDPAYAEFNKPWADVLNNEKSFKYYNFDVEKLPGSNSEEGNNNEDSDDSDSSQPPSSDSLAFKTDVIIPNEVAFLRINRMDGSRVDEDGETIRSFLEEIKDYDKLIIDIRGDAGGGDMTYWMKNVVSPLINQTLSEDYYYFVRGEYARPFCEARHLELRPLSELDAHMTEKITEEIQSEFDYYTIRNITLEPINPVGFKGKIYLLVNSTVKDSASESFAAFSKDSGFATLVGQSTGGEGIIIDPILFSLPNSGLVIRYNALLAITGDGNIHIETGVIPHIELDARPGPFETDVAIQYVINER